jgi:hypothetical protein
MGFLLADRDGKRAVFRAVFAVFPERTTGIGFETKSEPNWKIAGVELHRKCVLYCFRTI